MIPTRPDRDLIRLERLTLTEAEHAGLIRGSSRDRWLECAFGPGWVALLPVESNRWAFNIIRYVRSNKK